jgi:hypothetical protein
MKFCLKHPQSLLVHDGDAVTLGGNQDWFEEYWAQMAGCGPCVATNLVSYYLRRGRDDNPKFTRELFTDAMNDVYVDVVPPMGGIYTARLLTERMAKYFERKNLPLRPTELHIPARELPTDELGARERPPLPDFLPKPDSGERPEFSEIVDFIKRTLESDLPVLFLCLDSGEESRLDDWHWVTLVSFDSGGNDGGGDGDIALAEVSDNGIVQEIDLRKWYDTTYLGGGFASAEVIE